MLCGCSTWVWWCGTTQLALCITPPILDYRHTGTSIWVEISYFKPKLEGTPRAQTSVKAAHQFPHIFVTPETFGT